MNYLNKIIDGAAERLGSVAALEDYLEVPRKTLYEVKGGRRGLPDIAQAKLEELMELPSGTLRAPSAIITEKKPERVAYWKKKLVEIERLAACVLVGVILNMSPTPSQAAQMLQVVDSTVYIMSNLRRWIAHLKQRILKGFKMCIPETFRRPLVLRIDSMAA